MKCIVIETSPERTNAHPVTNEDGTPHIYATMTEARAELKANGYSYNRANQRYYIKGTEYRAYIIREDSEEYAEATATAEEPEQTTAEIIAEQARDYYHDTICSAITAEDIEQADAYTSARVSLTVEVMDALGIIRASNRMLVAIAQAMRWTLDDLEQQATEQAHEDAARRLVSAYAEAIGDTITEDDPETVAAYQVAREAIGHATATEEQRATVAAMVEAIAQSTTEDAAEHLADAAELMETDADKLAQAAWSAAEQENATQAETIAASIAAMVDSAQRIADACNRIAAAAGSRYAADLAEKTRNSAAMVEQYAYNAHEDAAEAEQRANDQTGRPYQRHELEAFLGEHLAEYDADAIEAEATEYDPRSGAQVWTAAAVEDLASICERHELTQYMRRQCFGDYSHADADTREEMESAALAFAAQEQTRPSVFSEIGARRARERYDAGTATAADLQALQSLGSITAEDAQSYRAAHGWTPRKHEAARHYYAQRSPYGVTTASAADDLIRFDSADDRDEWTERDPEHRAAITSSAARRWYPAAFAARQQCDRWTAGGEWTGRPTGGVYATI